MIWLRDWQLCQRVDCNDGDRLVQSQSQLRFWVQSLRSDARSIYALRTLVSTQAIGRGPGALSDDQVIDRFSDLLLRGRFHIHGQPSFTKVAEENKPKARVSIPGFDPPASSSKPAVTSRSVQPDDPATFPPNTDAAAQAAALTSAANSGAALCAVCQA